MNNLENISHDSISAEYAEKILAAADRDSRYYDETTFHEVDIHSEFFDNNMC